MDNLPHIAIPIRVIGGQYQSRQQDTDAEAADCVRNILVFAKGDRAEDLNFGIDDPTFQTQPIDTDGMALAIQEYEPRVNAQITTSDTPDGSTMVSIEVMLPTSDELPTEE